MFSRRLFAGSGDVHGTPCACLCIVALFLPVFIPIYCPGPRATQACLAALSEVYSFLGLFLNSELVSGRGLGMVTLANSVVTAMLVEGEDLGPHSESLPVPPYTLF